MNRRELFRSIAGVAAASGVTGTVKASTIDADPKPALAIIECDRAIADHTAQYLMRAFEETFKGTPFEGLKALMLCDGLKLTLLDANGHVLNRRLDDA